jgi:hypothetical protein
MHEGIRSDVSCQKSPHIDHKTKNEAVLIVFPSKNFYFPE